MKFKMPKMIYNVIMPMFASIVSIQHYQFNKRYAMFYVEPM